MYQDERMQAILHYLESHERIDYDTICEMNGVSKDTARRDLLKLEEERKLVRTRGGAKRATFSTEMFNYEQRLQIASDTKREIGKYASQYIQKGDYLILDASTTVQFLAEHMKDEQQTVVTNSIDIASILSGKETVSIHVLGGLLNGRHRSIYGSRTKEALKDYHVNKLFLGACGISLNGLTNPFEEESYLMKEMIAHADQVIVLADSTKFQKTFFHRVCGLEAIDLLITDEQLDNEWKSILTELQVEFLTVKPTQEKRR